MNSNFTAVNGIKFAVGQNSSGQTFAQVSESDDNTMFQLLLSNDKTALNMSIKKDNVWGSQQKIITNSDLPGLKLIQFTLPANGSKTISEKISNFSQLLFIQGTAGTAYGIYVLSGYGPGGTERYHVGQVAAGAGISVSINNASFVISDISGVGAICSLMLILGDVPTIS